MSEKPILFTGPMVRSLLDGRKTQTRRIVKPPRWKGAIWAKADQWTALASGPPFAPGPYVKMGWWHRDDVQNQESPEDDLWHLERVRCPYGYPEDGARLWVRETWAPMDADFRWLDAGHRVTEPGWEIWHKASGLPLNGDGKPAPPPRWRPSIHMPRWACRLKLRITRVRVERVQDISKEDILAEGVGPLWPTVPTHGLRWTFADLWDGINGKRAPWASNPWVWILDVEVAP